MIEDVYEPLSRYRDEFKAKFAALTRLKFKELTAASRVNVAANRRQVLLIKGLEAKLSSAKGWRTLYLVLLILGAAGVAVGLFVACTQSANASLQTKGICGILGGLALAIWMGFRYASAAETVRKLESEISAAKDVAWRQMNPLNSVYTWDLTVKLIEFTVPRLAFDPFFTVRRLNDLKRLYGWDDSFNEGRSIIFAQSGVINGNPFVICEYLEMEWGEKTYHGSLEISWEEEVEDDEGNTRIVTRYQTLHASVTKPVPVYSRQKVVIYGNDAAPNLSFTHHPTSLSGAEDGLITSLRKKWRLSRLEAYSRNLNDDSNFTLMANREFETLFHAKDRDHEVEFRLLFTALAQTQMLALMKDKTVGYGDDFTFIKIRKINIIAAEHLHDADIDTPPERFHDWDFDHAWATFYQFNTKYFKDVYFALAPLLAIPLYQQTRPHEDIWKGIIDGEPSSFWEHEATANYYGDSYFEHPECITQNILKTRVGSRADGTARVAVTAHGYRGIERVDYVSVWGGDGSLHEVPVEWIEYDPVEKTSEMCLAETHEPSAAFAQSYRKSSAATFRRAIYSYLPNG